MCVTTTAIWLAALVVLGNSHLLGQRPAPVEESNGDDIRQLLAEMRVLRESAPQSYDSLSTMLVATVQMHLGKMGFGTGPFTGTLDGTTRDAVRRFETARHLPPTGNPFTLETLSTILDEIKYVRRLELIPGPRLSGFAASLWDRGYVQVEGAWLMEPSESPFEESVRIECRHDISACEILYARIRLSDQTLSVDRETYPIASWDTAEIVSQPMDYPCTRYILRINRVQKSAILTRSTLSASGDCSHITPTEIVMHVASWPESVAHSNEARRLINALREFAPPADTVWPTAPAAK